MRGPDSEQKRAVVMLAAANHRPFDTRIFHKEARTLVKHGYRVTLIVPRDDTDQVEYVDGVQIRPVKFPNHGLEKLLITPWRIFVKAWQEPRRAIVHVHDSELLVMALVLRLSGRTLIYDAHEDTPLQISYQHWLPRWLKPLYAKFYYYLEKFVGRTFNQIIVAEPVIQRYFPSTKTILIHNFPIKAPFVAASRSVTAADRKNRVVYIGSITRVRGIEEMLQAVALARAQVDITLLLAGGFYPPLLEKETAQQPGVDYRGWVTLDELVHINLSSKIGLIVPHPVERYRTNLPVKVFEYMAAGLPVVLSESSAAAQFVRACDGGILVDPLKPQEIANALVYLMQHEAEAQLMGQRGQQLIFDQYHWESEGQRLLSLYHNLNNEH